MTRALLVLNNDDDRDTACRWARGVPLGSRIEFKETKRSLPQNDLMWALLTEVAQQMEHGGRKYDADQWKSILLHAFGREITFLPSLDLKTFLPIELSSSDLGKDEMTNFIEFILKEGTERGVIFRETNNPPSADDSPSPADVDGESPPETTAAPSAPADAPVSAGAKPAEFNFSKEELIHLKDFARKALADAADGGMAEQREVKYETMRQNYIEVIESKDGRAALEAMLMPLSALNKRQRTKEQAAGYIARDILSCRSDELMGAPDNG